MSTNPILKVISENESLRQQLQVARQEVEHFSKQNLEWAKCAASWQERAEKAEAELASLKAAGEGWIPCSERLPKTGEDKLIWLEPSGDSDIVTEAEQSGYAVGHLDANGYGKVITRPLTGPGEVKEQWPAWDTGDPENYRRASHWWDGALPPAPAKPASDAVIECPKTHVVTNTSPSARGIQYSDEPAEGPAAKEKP